MDLTVGQKLVFVYSDHRRGAATEVTVERVGRKWAYLAGNMGRIDDNLRADGGDYSSPGRCYGSWQEYEETTELAKAWDAFWRVVRDNFRRPEGVTLDNIVAARRALSL